MINSRPLTPPCIPFGTRRFFSFHILLDNSQTWTCIPINSCFKYKQLIIRSSVAESIRFIRTCYISTIFYFTSSPAVCISWNTICISADKYNIMMLLFLVNITSVNPLFHQFFSISLFSVRYFMIFSLSSFFPGNRKSWDGAGQDFCLPSPSSPTTPKQAPDVLLLNCYS